MKTALWLLDKLLGDRVRCQTRAHLSEVARAQASAAREKTHALLRRLAQEPGPSVLLGETEWREPVRLPLPFLAKAHAVITGGTGSGKTMAALSLIEALLACEEPTISFGVLDAKGELFERTLYFLARRLAALQPAQGEALRQRVVIIDLASPDPLTSYNIASAWSSSDLDFFATSRVDTFQELLPSGDGLSMRGGSIVRHALKLLAECDLPFSYFDHVLSSESFRAKLLACPVSDDLRHYFRSHFPNEGRATVAAVRGRVVSALFSSMSLKLALSGPDAPDFRRLQDEGAIVLINCAGPNIPRATARTLQALFLSDIRQAVFGRTNQMPYLWVCDEAQNFFRTKPLRENMADLLTMSRSFGAFFLYLTQNLATAVQDGEMLETLHTNIRWSLSLRGTPRDAAFLQGALPVTGRMAKPRANPYAPSECYSPTEKRNLLIQGIAHLPDRVGWLWLKPETGEAMKITTKWLDIPAGAEFQEAVQRIKGDARIGSRIPRGAYLAEMERRDAVWLSDLAPDPVGKLKKAFREDRD